MNCKHENEKGNFCSNCGERLKEKCSECGEMETIGRVVCETKIRQINKERATFVQEKSNYLGSIAIYLTLIFGICLAVGGFTKIEWLIGLAPVLFIVITIYLAVVYFKLFDKITKKAEKEFFRLHPDYTELLKRAEEKTP